MCTLGLLFRIILWSCCLLVGLPLQAQEGEVTRPSIILHKISGYTKKSIQRGTCPIIHRLAVATTGTATRLKSSTFDGNLYAKRREDGKYILIPPEKVEHNRDNPDGRNHLCTPPPNPSLPSDTV
jgi:hypothetical protein